MVAKVKFWLLEISSSFAKGSLSVMILKSSFVIPIFFLYNKAIFTRKATPPPWTVERSFLIVS